MRSAAHISRFVLAHVMALSVGVAGFCAATASASGPAKSCCLEMNGACCGSACCETPQQSDPPQSAPAGPLKLIAFASLATPAVEDAGYEKPIAPLLLGSLSCPTLHAQNVLLLI